MKKVAVAVNVQSAGFPNNAPDKMVEVQAYPTSTPGLVILPGLPYFDYNGKQYFNKDGFQIYSTKWGLPIGPRLNYRDLKGTLEVVARLNIEGLDWTNIPDCRLEENREAAVKYREALSAAL